MKFALTFLLLLLMSMVAMAEENPFNLSHSPSIDWQKMTLEDKIQEKISQNIRRSIPDTHFTVMVSLRLRPAAPLLQQKREPMGIGARGQESGEVIPLGKLGVDSSILQALTRQTPEWVDNSKDDLFKRIQSAEVNVLLDQSISETKSQMIQTIARTVLASLGSSVTNPQVRIQRTEFAPSKEEDSPKEKDLQKQIVELQKEKEKEREKAKAEKEALEKAPEVWDGKRWFVEMKVPLSVISAIVLIGLILVFLFGGYKNLENKRIALLEAQVNAANEANAASMKKENTNTVMTSVLNSSEMNPDMVSQLMSGATPGGTGLIPMEEGMEKGFDRLKKLVSESPERASQMIRQWIRNPKKGAQEALAVIPQVLTINELKPIFNLLSLDEKKEWKRFLGLPVSQTGVVLAESYVASQIVEDLLMPAARIDADVRRQLSELSLRNCVEIAKQDVELGALLANLLPSGQVARIFALLPPEQTSAITIASMKYTDEQIALKADKLKRAISALKVKTKTIPFMDHVLDLMKEVGIDKENSIFSALIESGEYDMLQAATKQYFPSELVLKLPSAVIRAVLDLIPLDRRAEIIYSRSESERELMLSSYGAPGNKLRDMIQIEIQQISNDQLKVHRIQRHHNTLWKEFVDSCRNQIRQDEMTADYAETLLSSWLFERTNGAIGGEVGRVA